MKKILSSILIIALSQSSFASADECNAECEAKIIQACTYTANHYPYPRDRLMYKEFGELFTEDATFGLEGTELQEGRDEIVAAMKKRGGKLVTRHLTQVVKMEVISPTTAEGVSYLTLLRREADKYKAGDTSYPLPQLFGEYHDKFEMQGDKCLFKQRVIKLVFKPNS